MVDPQNQRVVVIQDASSKQIISWSSIIKWALHGLLLLKHGDKLTFVSVLHHLHTPLGHKIKIVGSSNKEIVEEEVAKKKREYENNGELIEINKQCQIKKIEFEIKVEAGPSGKVVALQAAKKLDATWVILDRQMKKERKYFLEKLSCGISRMKRNNSIEKLRGPIEAETKKLFKKSQLIRISYDEMIPGSSDEDEFFSIETNCRVETDKKHSSTQIGYAEMIPGSSDLDELFSIELSPTTRHQNSQV